MSNLFNRKIQHCSGCNAPIHIPTMDEETLVTKTAYLEYMKTWTKALQVGHVEGCPWLKRFYKDIAERGIDKDGNRHA